MEKWYEDKEFNFRIICLECGSENCKVITYMHKSEPVWEVQCKECNNAGG